MRRTKTFFTAVAVAGVVAASGSAFTATNTVEASVAGYGTSTISGATATSVTYTLSADGTTITGADIILSDDQTGRTVEAGFGADTLTTCTVGAYVDPSTPVECTGFTASTSDSTAFNVAVS